VRQHDWDERYGAAEYAYGVEPNDFLRDHASQIPAGPVLCLAEGEGRNAVFLASHGHTVTAVDFSRAGLDKAERLARARGVEIELVEADLGAFDLGADAWSGIVSIFAHTPPDVRRRIHAAIPRALRVGGALVLEAYRPEQRAHATGGPRDVSFLPTLGELRAELSGLDLVIAREVDREIHEGRFHHGLGATVQIVGIRRG
jgi:ubiquinone/menaquinone biosynthesis C-methylase UbiE